MASIAISDAAQSAWWRLPRVIAETGLSRSTIYRRMDDGTFPISHAMRSTRAKVWFESDIRAWKRSEIEAAGLGDLL